MQILKANETEYSKRYGVSLKKQLEAFSGITEKESIDDFMVKSDIDAITIKPIPADVRLCYCIGLADGNYVRELRKTLSDVGRMVVYEPEMRVFLQACCLYDFSDLFADDQIDIVIGNGVLREELKHATLRDVSPLVLKHLYVICQNGYEDCYPGIRMELIKAVKDIFLGGGAELETKLKHSRESTRNRLCTLSLLRKSSTAGALFQRIPTREIPVILVGAGPSLSKNAKELKAAKNKALIISCTHAMETLERNQASADLAIMVDFEEGYDFCQHDKDRQYQILFHTQSAIDIQRLYAGKGIYFDFKKVGVEFPGTENEINGFYTGGSVVTCAFSLFLHAGFRKFILVGEDLAYAKEGHTHSGSYVDENESTSDSFVPAIDGGEVRTRDDWKIFLQFFKEQIQRHPEIQVIDATEGGALIEGTRVVPLKNAIVEFCNEEYPVQTWITGLPKYNAMSNDQVISMFEKYMYQCGNMQLILGDAIAYNEIIRNQLNNSIYGQQEYLELCEKYDKLYHQIMDCEDGELLRCYASRELYDYSEKAQFLERPDKIDEKLVVESDFYRALRMALSELRSYLQTILNDLKNETDQNGI